jgi:MATE family multidrug resistance protein
LHPPRPEIIGRLLRLGVPMGASILIEVTGFTFMALFISRLGATPVAGHQLAANLVAMMFMLPMALGNATGALVGQRIGAHDLADARRLGWHGLEIALLLSVLMGGIVFLLRREVLALYTPDPLVQAAALPLLLWLWLFHVGDACQAIAASVLRAHHVALAPMLVYALAIWGLGLGGGYWLAFTPPAWLPEAWRGASGFWLAASLGLLLCTVGLVALMAWVHRCEVREAGPQAS